MTTLIVTDVASGDVLDRVTLDGAQRLRYDTAVAEPMFEAAMSSGLSPEEAFRERENWSNGYIRTTGGFDPDGKLPAIPGLRELVGGQAITAAHFRFDATQPRDADGKWSDTMLSGKDAFNALDSLDSVAARIADKSDAARLGDAVSAYGGNQHQHINGSLRQGGGLYPGEKLTVRSLDAGLVASPLPEDVEVWRGMDGGRVFTPEWLGRSLVGAEWADPSFNSTSANDSVGEKFTEATPVPVLMRLRVPKGTGALRVGKWGRGGIGSEAEILLGRDHRYRVTADHGVVKGKRRIDVEVIPQAPKVVE